MKRRHHSVRGGTTSRTGLCLLTAIVVATIAPSPGGASAQTVATERIRTMLQQADAHYHELLPMAEQLGDPVLLQRLQTLRLQWEEAHGHFQGRRYAVAQRMAEQNLDRLRELGVTIRRMAQRLPYYGRMAERNRELLQLLLEGFGPSPPPEIQSRLTMAADGLQRAEQAHRQRNLAQSYRQMEQIETMLRQMLRQLERSGLSGETVESEIRETERRLEQLSARPMLSEPARQALERARLLQQEAHAYYGTGEFRLALSRTLTARSALRLAVGLAGERLEVEEVAAAIVHTEELIETYTEAIAAAGEGARALLQQARRRLERAQTDLAAGQLRAALQEAQSAAKLVLTAARRSEPPPVHTSPNT